MRGAYYIAKMKFGIPLCCLLMCFLIFSLVFLMFSMMFIKTSLLFCGVCIRLLQTSMLLYVSICSYSKPQCYYSCLYAVIPNLLSGLLIFRVVAETRISSKSTKSRKIRQKCYQIHVSTTYLKVILDLGAAYLL